ncbi:predicted protein [Histoplasma mississippiense (nom. inval.)]|uniref:predicted protein n=1 Tax=Ajellomyces capsulatus (strain NAm1 / WU24) TaxID=2059318 RepID=UPI000157B2AB|nr:predicted protein [Histoplasma mississippiense (nom. inval.)]EDN02276.1 predicted protein [Histoplasma mississippiense (nom. inval.)]
MLARSRASLSPSKFSEKRFEDFREADAYASKEKPVTVSVVPILDGDISDLKCVGGDYPFGNLAPLTDGTLASARPDHFYGSRPEQLNRQIRNELSSQIVPSTQDDLSIAPNFFLEVKGPDGSLAVATHQACYDGALGARGMHSLRSYEEDESTYDNNTYTLTSTYHGGQLKLYTTHLTKPSGPDYRPEYIMTQLNTWGMTGNLETFRQGVSAYRNARDWAKEKRAGVIRAANERFSETESQCHSASQHQMNSDIAATLDDSDISTVTHETEDVQWSFAAANKDVEDETQILNRNPKKSRAMRVASVIAANIKIRMISFMCPICAKMECITILICIKHGQRPCFRSLPKGMETCYAGEISMYTERENRIQVATLEKTQLIAKDFSELRIHFWPDVWPFMVGL